MCKFLALNTQCLVLDRTTVEYALKDSHKPIGVSTYHILEKLPEELTSFLPTAEEIVERLSIFDEKELEK
jgi:hypothetical protein